MTHEILPDLFFIERGYLNANHFVYRSEAPVLIDTGYKADFAETRQLITALGVDLSTVRLIVNTHTHCDHIGGNQMIQTASNCDIALHRVGKHFIDSGDDWATWWRYFDQEADFFKATLPLCEGDLLFIGPHEFRVIYTPGHAADGIALYNEAEKLLIASDALWESDIPVINLRVEGSRALFIAEESLAKLEALDVERVYPGHGSPFTDMDAAIARSRQKIERYLDNREQLGMALLKKIIVYTLLVKQAVPADDFFGYLLDTFWFRETLDFYFNGCYEIVYGQIMREFVERGIVEEQAGQLITTVKR